MTRSEKKKQRIEKWNKYKLEIIDKFENNIKEFGSKRALFETDQYIKVMCTIKYPSDKEIILNCANEFSNQLKFYLDKKLKA